MTIKYVYVCVTDDTLDPNQTKCSGVKTPAVSCDDKTEQEIDRQPLGLFAELMFLLRSVVV